MEVMVPINSPSDVKALSALGAREFYCGLPPVDASTVINRQDSYLRGQSDTKALLGLVQPTGIHVFFTLNMFYDPAVLPLLFDQLEEVSDMGRFGLIVSDVSLMTHLKKRFPDIPMVASVLGHSLNSRAVRFYHEAGCERVILGTHLNSRELNEIVSEWSPKLELEILVLNAGCFYEDGFCRFEHRVVKSLKRDSTLKLMMHHVSLSAQDRGPRALRQAFYAYGPEYNPCCLRPGEIEIRNESGARSDQLEQAAQSYFSMERFKHKCGLCFLHKLKDSGLAAVKIVGREYTQRQKKRDFLMVKGALDYLNTNPDFKEYEQACRHLFAERNGFDCERSFCYYSHR